MFIYVGNMPLETLEDELRRMFEAFGDVASAVIPADGVTGHALGFAFVEMPDREQALKAISQLDRTRMGERVVIVSRSGDRIERRKFNRPADAEPAVSELCDTGNHI